MAKLIENKTANESCFKKFLEIMFSLFLYRITVTLIYDITLL